MADRLTRRGALLGFAVAELATGVFGLASKWGRPRLLHEHLLSLAISPYRAAPVLFLGLLWPTFFMGLSLPLLSRALTRTVAVAAGAIGSLYAWNTLGAAAGAIVATWIMLPRWGLGPIIQVAAALNLFAALAVLPLSFASELEVAPTGAPDAPSTAGAEDHQPSGFSMRTWLFLYGISGFSALSLEIIWFRVLGVMLKSTAFTFGTLLGIYLLGFGVGTLAGLRSIRRSRRPVLVFLFAQAGVSILAAGFIALLVHLLDRPAFSALHAHLAGNDPVDAVAGLMLLRETFLRSHTFADRFRLFPIRFVGLSVILPAAMIGPSTFLMGFSFPFLQKATQADLRRLGRRVGGLQVANIAGCLLGAVLTGWVGLAVLGVPALLRMIALAAALFLFLAARTQTIGRLRAVPAAGTLLVAAVVFGLPSQASFWSALHGTTPGRLIVVEDGTGVAAAKRRLGSAEREHMPFFDDQRAIMFVNGVSQSWMVRWHSHRAGGAAGDGPPESARDRTGRSRIGRHGVRPGWPVPGVVDYVRGNRVGRAGDAP